MHANFPESDFFIVTLDGEFFDAGAYNVKKMHAYADKIHEFMIEILKNEQMQHGYWHFGFDKKVQNVGITFIGCSCICED